MIVCLTKIFVDKMDYSIEQRRDEMMAVLKLENERLKDELLAKLAEREKYVQERETTYQQMRKDLESQMNTFKGKVIALRTENILLQADLEVKISDLEKVNEKVKCLTTVNEKRKRKELSFLKEQHKQRKTRAQVLKAFNWKKESADTVLLAAACAFWDSFRFSNVGKKVRREKARVSKLDRMKAWKDITLHGWNGAMHKEIDFEFMRRKRYCAIKMSKASDMESRFNVKVSTDIQHCDPCRKKYSRGLLPSDRTCRRVQ